MTPVQRLTKKLRIRNDGRPRVAVTISVHYGDILKYSLPALKPHADRVLVLTTPDDTQTQEVCKSNGVECLRTIEFYAKGHPMNLGRGYNVGFNHLDWSQFGWCMLMNADIILPKDFSQRLPALNPLCLYGARRWMCKRPEDWKKFRELGDRAKWRLKDDQKFGAVPGYLQLFSVHRFRQLWPRGYPIHYQTAGHADLRFAKRWGSMCQLWLPVDVIHLGPDGVNWKSRVSPRFE